MYRRYLYLILTLTLIFLSICLIFSKQIISPAGLYVDETRNTDGSLSFTVRTVSYGGPYAPRNSGAIWITNASGTFVKTLKVWAQTYRWTLVRWIASSGNNTTGAITSASLNSHQLHSVTWNGTNVSNASVADGDYKVNVEFTEHNATTSNPGKYKYVSFAKGAATVDITPANEAYFSDLHLTWTPVIANGTISGTVTDGQNNPISNAVLWLGALTTTTSANGSYSFSVQPGTYSISCEASGFQTQTSSNLVVLSGQVTQVNFILAPTAAEDQTLVSPKLFLKQNYPNPFQSMTSIDFYLEKAEPVALSIYNIRGQLLKSLVNSYQVNGWHTMLWDGKDTERSQVPSGIYYLKLVAGGVTQTKAITIRN
jgi:flagellar hook assembly protein FlgD